jgi:hypothetical protein
MSINVILNQLQDSYGKPNMMTLFNNNALFRSPMTPTNSPEMLFYCIEQCQEIQPIGKLPNSNDQIITPTTSSSKPTSSPSRNLTHGEHRPPRRTQPSRHSSMRCTGKASQQWHCAARQGKIGMRHRTCTMCGKATTTLTRTLSPPSPRQQPLQLHPPQALPPLLCRPSMRKLPQQSTNYWQIKRLSCCRWRQCYSHRPRLSILASMCHATHSKCRL